MTLEIKAIIVAILLSLVFWGGCSVQKNLDASEIAGLNIKIEKGKTELAEERQKAAETQLAKTREAEAAVTAIDKKHTEEQERAKKDFDRTIADLRADNIRVRKAHTCPSGPTSLSDGEEGGGLSTDDAEFLLRESERADDVVRQLTELQEYVELLLKQK
jgi:hypothetical protein